MAWIESHQTLGRHPKTLRAAAALGVSRPCIVGHLHYLWWWCVDYAADGDLSAMSDHEIAAAAEWDGDPGAFVSAFITAGFIDRGERTEVHDWQDFAGRLILAKEADAARKRAGRKEKAERTSGGHPADIRTPSAVTKPNLTVPNLTEQNRTNVKVKDSSAQKAAPGAPRSKRFIPPTVEQVREYMASLGMPGQAEAFVDHYASNGWHVGKTKMEQWKNAASGWVRREREKNGKGRPPPEQEPRYREFEPPPKEFLKERPL